MKSIEVQIDICQFNLAANQKDLDTMIAAQKANPGLISDDHIQDFRNTQLLIESRLIDLQLLQETKSPLSEN